MKKMYAKQYGNDIIEILLYFTEKRDFLWQNVLLMEIITLLALIK